MQVVAAIYKYGQSSPRYPVCNKPLFDVSRTPAKPVASANNGVLLRSNLD